MATSNVKQEVKEELQTYLKDKGINALFVSIVESLLVEKPDEPVSFVFQFLMANYPTQTEELLATAKLSAQEEITLDSDNCSDSGSDSDESSEDEDQDEDQDETKPLSPIKNRPTRRRASICAEKMCPDKVGLEEVKKIPKTDEELSKIREILLKCVLFEHLDETQLRTVKDAMFRVSKEEDEVIIKQGDDGDNFYVIESGDVDVYIDSSGDEPSKLVNSYNNGDSFGELAIMYNAPRAATCIARGGPVKLWALDRSSFKVILMKAAMSRRKLHKTFLEEVPILSEMTEHEILTVADALHEESFEDGTVICEEGAVGDRFYIIKKGSVICKKFNEDGSAKEVANLKSGSYFGEVALVTMKKRQATVISSGACECLSLDRQTFKRVMGSLQDILMRNMETYNKFQASNI